MLAALLVLMAAPAGAQEVGDFELYECPFDIPAGAEVECGYLTVPERHAVPDGPTFELAVAILYASSATPKDDAVVYLEGGPGGSALSGIDGWYDALIARDRDLILFDQRGTGYSDPGLFCELYDYDFDIEEADTLQYAAACAEYLAEDGIDVSVFNSAESAADVALLVEALGYDRVNLYSISYGTRVALTVMRDYPQVVRAVVLDSPFPPEVTAFEEQAPNGWGAMQALFASCAAQASCARAFPNLQDRFTAFLTQLDANPQVYDFGDGEYEYDGGALVSTLFDVMYDHSALPYLPLALHELIEGDPEGFAALVSGEMEEGDDWDVDSLDEEDFDPSDSDGTYYSVHCVEEVPFESRERTLALAADIPPAFRTGLMDSVLDLFEACKVWGAAPATRRETEPVVSSIPTLVLAGQYDPITPPHWGEVAVRSLSNSVLVVVPGAGHSLIDAGNCPAALGVAWLNNPGAPLDTSCIERIAFRFETEW